MASLVTYFCLFLTILDIRALKMENKTKSKPVFCIASTASHSTKIKALNGFKSVVEIQKPVSPSDAVHREDNRHGMGRY